MNTKEKIKHAENRIDELQLLINPWKLTSNFPQNQQLSLVKNQNNICNKSIAA